MAYPALRDFLRAFPLDGADLELEEPMSLAGTERLIDRLREDFGPGFFITLAPVGSKLGGGARFSGLDYDKPYRDRGEQINRFHVQMYNGWGSMATTADYDRIIRQGVVPASKVVAGTPTNPDNGTAHVPVGQLKAVVEELIDRYPDFAGIDGWEYYNALPGGTSAPWQWAVEMSAALRHTPGADRHQHDGAVTSTLQNLADGPGRKLLCG
ncbi:hypothetical protein [Streptomyces sp. NPDC046727]|uniref:hypothetical protein n=1 Tax=Streptomyces sp. NPDC046727 TaxID=3155373 RepID=UPI0034059F52